MRPRAEKSYTPNRKTAADGEGLSFGKTRRIRTADLYHVKADWPHQGMREPAQVIVPKSNGQLSCGSIR